MYSWTWSTISNKFDIPELRIPLFLTKPYTQTNKTNLSLHVMCICCTEVFTKMSYILRKSCRIEVNSTIEKSSYISLCESLSPNWCSNWQLWNVVIQNPDQITPLLCMTHLQATHEDVCSQLIYHEISFLINFIDLFEFIATCSQPIGHLASWAGFWLSLDVLSQSKDNRVWWVWVWVWCYALDR